MVAAPRPSLLLPVLLVVLYTAWLSSTPESVCATSDATPAAASAPRSATALATANPSGVPASLLCDLPPEALAPTAYPSSSAQPTLRLVPRGALDAAMSAARAATLRRHTAQCGRVLSDTLADASARLIQCDDFPRAIREGTRDRFNGPFRVGAGCSAVWWSPGEACDLLQRQGRLVVFVGDSLNRGFLQGVWMALTGSYQHAGVPKFSAAEGASQCQCDGAFEHRDCRSKSFAFYEGPGHVVCPKWGQDASYVAGQISIDNANYFLTHDSLVSGWTWLGQQMYRGTTIVVNLGVHDAYDAEYVASNVYSSIIADAQNKGDVRVICVLAPWVEMEKKPAKWRESQGHEQVRDFNAKLRRYCEERGAETFDMSAPTYNLSSMDGMHRGLDANGLMGQLFLNLLAQGGARWGWEDARKGLGEDGFLL